MTYFPKEIFTTIVDYCGETPKAKHAKTWKTIQPRIRRNLESGNASLCVEDGLKGMYLEFDLHQHSGIMCLDMCNWIRRNMYLNSVNMYDDDVIETVY